MYILLSYKYFSMTGGNLKIINRRKKVVQSQWVVLFFDLGE